MYRSTLRGAAPAIVLLLVAPVTAPAGADLHAQSEEATPIDGPPAPTLPEVISRDADGNATVRAVRIDEPLRIDGELDEGLYTSTRSFSGFIQSVPDEGAPATERTEAWVSFDDDNVYVSARIWDSAPESEWVANELRRDTNQLRENDTFGVVFDTFYDRRNAVMFYTNPLGALAEFAIDERREPQHRLEPRLGRSHGSLRRWVDGRDGDSVQVAPLSAGNRSSVGHLAPARGPSEKRVDASHADSPFGRA